MTKTTQISTIRLGTLIVLASSILAGLRPLFAKLVEVEGINSAGITLYTVLFSSVIFGGYSLTQPKRIKANLPAIFVAIASGVGIGLGTIAYFEALTRLPVTTVTVIYFSTPAIVTILESVIHQRWPSKIGIAAVCCVLIGCMFIIGFDGASGEGALIDYLIAFIAPLTWSILLITMASTLADFPAWAQVGFISTGALVPTLILLMIWPPVAFLPSSASGWWGLLGLVVITGMLTQLLTSAGVSRAGSERASIMGVFEMITAVAIGWFVLSEPVTLTQVIGAIFIVIAIVLTSYND